MNSTSTRQPPVRSIFPDGELGAAAELGAVDSRGVRVWVRQPGVPELRADLHVEGQPPVSGTTKLSADTDWTGVIELALPAPAPDAPFTCIVGERRLRARLAAAADAHAGLTFAFGSCNRPFELRDDGRVVLSEAAGLYRAMADELERQDARFVVLAGDQIYSDELEPVSVRTGLSGDEQHPPPLEEALDAYRRVSRGFLGQSGYRALRERFPIYCIWDDHEIFNNWGSRLEESPLDHRLFEAACRVYCEYQHVRNPGGAFDLPPYNYTFRHGDIGFLVLDLRGKRDYDEGRLLGAAQWQEVREYLHGEDARTLQTLFVVSGIPIAHVSRWVAKLADRLGGELGDSVRDRWCSSALVRSRDEFLEELFTWQTAAPGRQVCVLSGDVHCASAFTIRQKRGPGVVRQFTSSALTTPHTTLHQVLNLAVVRAPNLFEPNLRFRRHLLSFANNYGLVRVRPLARGGHRISFTVRGWRTRTQALHTMGRVVSLPSNDRIAGRAG
jgi:alkaline phosphatase D